MYSSDLGWCSVNTSINSASDDRWIAHRLGQIANGAQPSELISRWSFKTQNSSRFSYLYHVMIRISSYACFIIPALLVATPAGERIMDYLFDRGCYCYFKIKGMPSLYEQRKQLTQLFLTLAVAEERLSRQEAVDQMLRGRSGRRLYPNHLPIQANSLNRELLTGAIQKTKSSLSEEDLKTLLAAIQITPRCISIAPRLHKEYALETIKRCTGKITLPEGLKFNGNEIDAFIHTRCIIELNGASFIDLPQDALTHLEKHVKNSIWFPIASNV